MKKINDTPEEAKIRKEFAEKGIKGLSPAKVIDIPKAELEPMVLEGLSDIEIGGGYGVSGATIAKLRKFYGLPLKVDVKKMLTCITKEHDEVIEMEIKLMNDGTLTELVDATVEVVKKDANSPIFDKMTEHIINSGQRIKPIVFGKKEPLQVMIESTDPPLLDIENQAVIITPLLQGIAKYLERLGKEKVQVTVVVRRVG